MYSGGEFIIIKQVINDLCCPMSLAQFKDCNLTNKNNSLHSTLDTYPIIKGVPDLRLADDRVSGTSYDSILPDWKINNHNHDYTKMFKYSGIEEKHITGKKVLVAGVGTGTELDLVLKCNPRIVYAIDFSNHLLKLSEDTFYKNKNIYFFIGDLCNLPFKPETFDYVISGGIIHHTRSPELAHRNIWRTIKNKGYLNYIHIYLENLHNRRVSIDRLISNYHNKNVKSAKRNLKYFSYIYFFLIKTRILKFINRKNFRFPFLLELNGNVNASEYYNGAIDYYLPRYRHVIPTEDVFSWFKQVGSNAQRTPKGFIGRKEFKNN